MTDPHKVARCRWCLAAGRPGRFVQQFGWQWRCEHEECFDRCVAEAIRHPHPEADASPFFYLPLPLQVEAEQSQVKRLLVWGAAGISKSFGARMSLYKRCQKFPGYQALLLRCTLDQLKKNHLVFMEGEAAVLGECKYVGSYPIHMAFKNGSRMYAGYCDDEADVGQHLGPEWDEVLMEESGFFRIKALEEIPARDRGSAQARPSMAKLGIRDGRTRLLANPGGRGWLYLKDFYIDCAPDPERYPHYETEWYGSLTGDVEDNPYLHENFRRANLGGLNAERYAQLAHGRSDVFEGQFFSAFQPAVHVTATP